MKEMLYLIGEPGAGKSTLATALTAGCLEYVAQRPFAHTVWQFSPSHPTVIELGYRREEFSGTDALSMSVQPKVLDFLELDEPALVFGEGDRLSTGSFFEAVATLGYNLTLAHISVPADVGEARRKQRATQLGREPQDNTWVQGRKTKIAHIVEEFTTSLLPVRVITVDGTQPVVVMLSQVESPVTAALLGKETWTRA